MLLHRALLGTLAAQKLELGTRVSRQRQGREDEKPNKLLPVPGRAIQKVIKRRGMRFRAGMNGGSAPHKPSCWSRAGGSIGTTALLPQPPSGYSGKSLWLLQVRIRSSQVLCAVVVHLVLCVPSETGRNNQTPQADSNCPPVPG